MWKRRMLVNLESWALVSMEIMTNGDQEVFEFRCNLWGMDSQITTMEK
jgi:hypothetical protein